MKPKSKIMLNQKSIATPELKAKLATAHKIFLSFEGHEVAAIIAALEFVGGYIAAGLMHYCEGVEVEAVITANNTALQKIADAFDDEQKAERIAKLLNSYTNENF